MQKFEITKEGVKSYEVIGQCCTSDIARFIPGLHGVTEDDVKVFMLDEDLYKQGKPLIDDFETYYCDHKTDGSIEIKEVDGDALVLTITATLKTWSDLYDTVEGKKVYKL